LLQQKSERSLKAYPLISLYYLKLKQMIPSSISWDIYLDWAVLAVVIYYLLILTICYKKETRGWLKRAGGKSSVFAIRRDADRGGSPGRHQKAVKAAQSLNGSKKKPEVI
jgi:hypothetical protein